MHIKEKTRFTIQAVTNIQSLNKLSLQRAVKLLLKIVPILMYNLEMPWEHLRENSIKTLESVKATHLEKGLRVSRFTPLPLVYVLTT
jgi:hypothetical protein